MSKTVIATVFEIIHSSEDIQTFNTPGSGQKAATRALKESNGRPTVLKGFLINGVFHEQDLRDHFQRQADQRRKKQVV